MAADLKDVFGTSTHSQNEQKEELAWDKEEDKNEDDAAGGPAHVSFSFSTEAGNEASSGFKFSFFGDNAATETTTKKGEHVLSQGSSQKTSGI